LFAGRAQRSRKFGPRRSEASKERQAARFIDMMEQDRIDQHGGPGQGAKPREILVGPEYLQKVGR